jgi:hydroxymethylglutaryl-CoA reductase
MERFLELYKLAEENVYRATTHNKGIMNGVIGVANALGQDTRAIEVAAHSYACKNGKYKPLSKWYREEDFLVGEIELPLPVGIVGGATTYPHYKVCQKILGVRTAKELQEILAAVGLANNFSAMQEIVSVGVMKGHMKLHKRREA